MSPSALNSSTFRLSSVKSRSACSLGTTSSYTSCTTANISARCPRGKHTTYASRPTPPRQQNMLPTFKQIAMDDIRNCDWIDDLEIRQYFQTFVEIAPDIPITLDIHNKADQMAFVHPFLDQSTWFEGRRTGYSPVQTCYYHARVRAFSINHAKDFDNRWRQVLQMQYYQLMQEAIHLRTNARFARMQQATKGKHLPAVIRTAWQAIQRTCSWRRHRLDLSTRSLT